MLDILCESSAWQRIHMKHKPYCLRKIKVKIIKMSSAAILLGALRVNFVDCVTVAILVLWEGCKI